MFVFADENADVTHKLSDLTTAVAAIPADLGTTERALKAAQETVVQDVINCAERIEIPADADTPSAKEFTAVVLEPNDALLRTIVISVIVLALLAVNTLMLREFFASFISLRVFGIQISLVVSCFFSLLEVALGACYTFVGNGNSSLPRLVVRIGAPVLVLFMASIEWHFYAKFGEALQFDNLDDLFGKILPGGAGSWFAVFGVVISFALFVLGDLLFVALQQLFRGNVVRRYRAFLRARMRYADSLRVALGEARESTKELKQAISTVSAALAPIGRQIPKTVRDITEAKGAFEEAFEKAKRTRLEPYKEVGRSEMLWSYYTGIFRAISVVITYFIIAIAFGAFGLNTPVTIGHVTLPGFAVALGEIVLVLGAGNGTGRLMVSMTTDSEIAKYTSRSNVILAGCAYAVAITVVAGDGLTFLNRGTFIDVMWFAFTCAACFWLFVVGRSLGLTISAVWVFIQSCVVLLASAVAFLAGSCLLVVRLVIALFRALLELLAYPMKALRRLFGRGEGPVGVPEKVIGALLIAGVMSVLTNLAADAQGLPLVILQDRSEVRLHEAFQPGPMLIPQFSPSPLLYVRRSGRLRPRLHHQIAL